MSFTDDIDETEGSPKFKAFVVALDAVCKEHKVCLSVSGYDGMQVWDVDDIGVLVHCCGIEDMTE